MAVAAGLAGCNTQLPAGGQQQETTTEQPASDAVSAYSRVYRETIDSVVLVRVDGGQGSGFVFREGYVATNAHVVGGAEAGAVRFHGGQWSDATVVGVDAHSDLAAVRVEDAPEAATPLSFADGDPVIGQEVVAIGNPFNLSGSLTVGVVSGVDRAIPAPTGFRIPDAVQTDAAINPGNSGGPLADLDGQVVAVVNSGGGDNIAFGVSAALARRVLPALVETGEFRHSYVGLSFEDVTPASAAANDLEAARGLLVLAVDEEGPSAGVIRGSDDTAVVDGQTVPVGGDVLLSVAGTRMETGEDLLSVLSLQTSPGDTVDVELLRDGARRTVQVELGAREQQQPL